MAEKIYRVNMTTLSTSTEEVSEQWKGLGGRGLTSTFVAQEVKKDGKIPHFDRSGIEEIIKEAKLNPQADTRRIGRSAADHLFQANRRVKIPQPSTDCLVPIGEENLLKGLQSIIKAEFYTATSRPPAVYRGNPFQIEVALAYGGITTALLDETIGRAIMMRYKEMMWGVTVEFTTKFKKAIPLNQELRVVGRITNENPRFFEGTGELLLPNGEVAATGTGKYIKMPIEKIADFNPGEQEWKITPSDDDPQLIELP